MVNNFFLNTMKMKVFLFLIAMMPLLSFGALSDKDPIFGKYGFANQTSLDSFMKYSGKTVTYIPCRPISYIEKNVFKTEKFVPGAEYIITSIKKDKSTYKNNIIIKFK